MSTFCWIETEIISYDQNSKHYYSERLAITRPDTFTVCFGCCSYLDKVKTVVIFLYFLGTQVTSNLGC